MPSAIKSIREIEGVGPQQLSDEILLSTEPIVLRGLVASWPMVHAALTSELDAIDYLRRFYRDATVNAMYGMPEIGGRFFYNDDLSGFNFTLSRVRLDAVLDALRDHRLDEEPPAIYVGSTTIDACLPGFRVENDLGVLGSRNPLMSIWLGNRTRIPAHFDLPDNLACVAAGRRRFTVFPPEQLRNLYIGPLDFTPAGQAISLVDFSRPDFERFPNFSTALENAQVAELQAGDALFLPSMWWHHIEATDNFNVLVNYWWRQSPEFMDTPMNTLMHALMTMRDLPSAQRLAWQEIFRHYVFESDGEEASYIPQTARRVLAPFNGDSARMLRAHLLNKMKR